MSTVVVKNGNVEFALRNLKQKNAKDGLLKAARERNEGYMKPGVKRRKAKKEAIINSRKRARRESYNQEPVGSFSIGGKYERENFK